MKKRIAIVLTLILATGTFTACTAEEKVNDTNKTSVVSTADVSSSTESSEPLPTENVTEITTTEKPTVSQNTEPTETDTKFEQRADSGQNSAKKMQTKQTVEVRTNTKNIENVKVYAKYVFDRGMVPVIPHFYATILDDGIEAERNLGKQAGISLLFGCDAIWVFGDKVTSGMKEEIQFAKHLKIEIKYISKEELGEINNG